MTVSSRRFMGVPALVLLERYGFTLSGVMYDDTGRWVTYERRRKYVITCEVRQQATRSGYDTSSLHMWVWEGDDCVGGVAYPGPGAKKKGGYVCDMQTLGRKVIHGFGNVCEWLDTFDTPS